MESSDFAHEMSLASGQRFFEKLASTGGTCDTYRVRINGKWHFLKRPKGEMSSNPLYITAFEREFDIGYRLEHKSLVRYIDKGIDQQGIYILTEMIDGCTLDEFVAKNPEYFKNKKHVERFVSQMLDVLDYLHSNQVLHLDLKPSNIMMTRIGRNVKLIDLGFAYSECYNDFAVGMTNEFAAPEQRYSDEVGPWTDFYALGKVLLWVCNFGNKKDGVRAVPMRYRGFVRKCVDEDSKKRFATDAEAQLFVSSRHSKFMMLAGVLILAITLAGVVFWSKSNHDKNDNSIAVNNSIKTPTNGVDSIVVINQVRQAAYSAEPVENKIVTRQEQGVPMVNNQEKVLSPSGQPHGVIVPESLKSKVRSKAKAAFSSIDYNFTSLDDYQKRSKVLAEIKKARHEILEYAKSQASSNEEMEKYYTVAMEIINDEYAHSNLFRRLSNQQ